MLRVKVEADEAAIESLAYELVVPPDHEHKDFLTGCVRDALSRLLLPSLEREVRRELTEKAETHAVKVFAENLRNLLLQPPLQGKRVLAVDPGYKNGCKLAVLDEFGKLLDHGLVFVVGSEEQKTAARAKIAELVRQFELSVVAIGNGSACRQTEQLVAEIIGDELADIDMQYVVVNEAARASTPPARLAAKSFPNATPSSGARSRSAGGCRTRSASW